MIQTKIDEQTAEQILDELEELDDKLDQIKRDVGVMMEIHEMLHPEEVEKARRRVEEGHK